MSRKPPGMKSAPEARGRAEPQTAQGIAVSTVLQSETCEAEGQARQV